jgi:hypothetical protein
MSFKKFKEFTEQAQTRCGVTFEIKTAQQNYDGVITAVKGAVYVLNEDGKSAPLEMLWNLKGQAMLVGEQFDLIKELPVEDVEEDAPTLLQPEK